MTVPNGLGDVMRDPEEAAARIDAWAEGFAKKAERYQAAQERTEQIRLTAGNQDGSVKVTVRADGSVTDLDLSGRARSMPLEELSQQILATMRKAQSGIADRVAEVMAEEIGGEDPQTRSLMVDSLRSRFPETEDDEPSEAPDEQRRAEPADHDEDENNPW